ncbi:MAG TPA: glycoside hydrolase family 30 beta sandwich domain-containing protein [Terriglobales bacterium]|nr:glycoside hydrolase family 30 beta sandwich domain-containing protein [Terriglobales bacterium]
MSASYTRRTFLATSGLAAAALASVPQPAKQPSGDVAQKQPGEVSVWVTDDHHVLSRVTPVKWQIARAPALSNAISLDPQKKSQEILGFGAAFTDAACFMLNQLSPAARDQLFHTLFHSSEMGFSVCRSCIGASDYSATLYSYDDGDVDPELKRFSIGHDRAYILPIIRAARKVNPDLFLFASPWSPPGWMKANGSMLGGSMRRAHMPSYANYFLKFLQAYEDEGVPVQAVTIQNEVDTDQDGRMPACIWPQEYEVDFVTSHLGPLFRRTGTKTKIWLIDHNYNLWGRALAELESPGLRDYANAIAWHGYVGQPEWMDRVHNAYPDVDMFWTEGGPDYTAAGYASDWAKWSAMFTGILRNCCRSITAWNFALDERGRPNIGPFSCGGLVTIDSQNKAISHSGQFRAFAHFSHFLPRGSRRFESQSKDNDIQHVGFETPAGQNVLVLTNSGSDRNCQLRLDNYAASLSLSQNSVTTLVWSS